MASNVTTLPPSPMTTIPSPVIPVLDEGMSGGSVFCLFFFFITAIYFGGGVLVRKFMRGAEGYETLPHYTFWVELPNLIRDGIVFTLNGCQPELSYERI